MKLAVFSEKTLVPVSLVITMAGAIYWAASVANATDENARDISAVAVALQRTNDDLASDLREQSELLNALRVQVSGVDAKLQSLAEFLKAEKRRLYKRND